MLQTEHLTYRIDKRMLVNSVSMRARAGELLAIVGPNGPESRPCCDSVPVS